MSNTPETDLLLSDQHHDCVPFDDSCGQLAEKCKKLERERDEAREISQKYEDRYFSAIIERDEAQAAFAIATDQLVVAQSQARQWHQCAKKLAPFVVPIPADMADHTACVGALAEFERLKEDGK